MYLGMRLLNEYSIMYIIYIHECTYVRSMCVARFRSVVANTANFICRILQEIYRFSIHTYVAHTEEVDAIKLFVVYFDLFLLEMSNYVTGLAYLW